MALKENLIVNHEYQNSQKRKKSTPQHWPKYYLNLHTTTEPVTVGADTSDFLVQIYCTVYTTVYTVQNVVCKQEPGQDKYRIASAP